MARTAQPITLSDDDLTTVTDLLRRGTSSARTQTRARVLDLLHRGQHPTTIAAALRVSSATVFNIKRRYLAAGLDATLHDQPRSGKPRAIDGLARAQITALACADAPQGHARWTLRLLADKAVDLGFVDQVSHTTVHTILKKPAPAPPPPQLVHWQHQRGVSGTDGRYFVPVSARLRCPSACHLL